MRRRFALIGGFVTMILSMSEASVKTYGYVPLTFPRDPAEVNQFAEHIVLGQIIEPLVDTDQFGNVVPGLAESWTFDDKGKTIHFKVRSDREFSNGKKVTSADIKFTLDRMISKKSQSSTFIASIELTQAPAPEVFILKLREPNVSLLKALSRDQLGIVPENWSFDKNSSEPLIGSGPYRLMRKNEKWILEANPKSPLFSKISVKQWELLSFSDSDMNVPETRLPDYAPGISLSAKSDMEKVKGFEKLIVSPQTSFAQTSAWWHPHGGHFASDEFKARAMAFVEDVFAKGTRKLGLERATGVIPKGVAGHSAVSKAPKFPAVKRSDKLDLVKLAFVGATFDDFLKDADVETIARAHGFKTEILKISPAEFSSIPSKRPDIIFAGWAGGFNDPEGFIALLPTFLIKDFDAYIGPELSKKYRGARQEQNWTDRSAVFQEINERLRHDGLMAPGWRIPFFIAGQPNLVSEEATFRYTPRLHLVKERK